MAAPATMSLLLRMKSPAIASSARSAATTASAFSIGIITVISV